MNIDEAYDKLINISDIKDKDTSKLKFISEDELNNNIPHNVFTDDNADKSEVKPKIINSIYDQATGNIVPTDDIEIIGNEEKDRDLEKFFDEYDGTVKEINEDVLKDILKSQNIKDIEDALKISELVKRRINGEKFNPYNELPESIKSMLNLQLMQFGAPMDKKSRSYAADMLIDDLANEYSNKMLSDLDSSIKDIEKEFKQMNDDIIKDIGETYITLDEDRIAAFDESIRVAKENNDLEKVKKLEDIKKAISDSYNLTDFKEFCKSVKIKKIEIEKPNTRVFSMFNQKYINHKNVINDISQCPTILSRHLSEDHIGNLKVCIAFCKYCKNMNPDNIVDHSFMYYFIRNIIAIDRMNPKGLSYNTMNDKCRKFYDGFINNIKECIANINNK